MKEKEEAEENKSEKMGKKGTRRNTEESYSYRRGLFNPWNRRERTYICIQLLIIQNIQILLLF